jgi:DNA (cytosine-5)-methyltransferase 1
MDLVAAQGMRVSRTQINDLLPTPNTMEHREIKTPEQIAELKAKSPGGYRNLRESVVNEMPVFPTPIVRDYKDGQAEVLRNGKVQTDTVGRAIMNSGEVSENKWGKFESAVRLWEQEIEREAPSPTKPDGKEGAHRLSSKFTEWMMGLPEGWITDVGLTRNEELKLAGNGVVPQQAELALRLLLNSDEE